jgi:hypothetical protein
MFTIAARRLSYIWKHPSDFVLLVEITAWLSWAWLILKFLPFRQTAEFLQPKIDKQANAALFQLERNRLCRLIRAVSRRLPWRTVCFHQGIAAQRILCRQGIAADLHYGVLRRDESFVGHVWVAVQGEIILGGEGARACTYLMTFSPLKPDL